jgi:uncharacterized membrane protein YcaP (DUF421 family)
MIIVFLRAIILYILIIFCVRLMGKRQLGELQPSELVITIMLSNIATLPIQDINLPMLMGTIPILTLVSLDVIISAISLRSRTVRRWVCGSPKIIIKDGVINQKVMKELRFSIDDLMESLRTCNVFDISEVQYAIVETTGNINVYQKFENQNCTPEILNIKGESKNPPQLIVDDGKILPNSLELIGFSESWLQEVLKSKKIALKDIFLMTADDSGSVNIIKKEDA